MSILLLGIAENFQEILCQHFVQDENENEEHAAIEDHTCH